MHFSLSLFCAYSEILWRTPAIFSKLSCNGLQLWTIVLVYVQQLVICRTPLESTSVFWKSRENFYVGRRQLYGELHRRLCSGNFPKRLKQYQQLLLFGNLSITIESNQLAVKNYWASETKRVNFCFTYCSQEKKKKNKHSQVFLILEKNTRKWNYEWVSVLKTCTVLIVGIFQRIC